MFFHLPVRCVNSMLESSCQNNPLQKLASIKDKSGARTTPFEHVNKFPSQNRFRSTEAAFYQTGASSSSLISDLPTNNITLTSSSSSSYCPANTRDDLPQLVHISHQFSKEHRKAPNDDSILPQFSLIQINDPLEFSDEYKKFYSSYEKPQQVMPPRPILSRFQHYSVNKPNLRTNRKQDMTNIYDRSIRDDVQRSVDMHMDDTNNEMIDKEFEVLENELKIEQQGANDIKSVQTFTLDSEQLSFKNIASSIIDTVTPKPSRATTPIGSKLEDSKFMKLMGRVSEGEVTLRNNSPELYTPETDEVVGNEYFHIIDNPTKLD